MAKCLCPNPIPLPKMSCTLLFWKSRNEFTFSGGNDLCSEPWTEICFANGSLLLYLLFAQTWEWQTTRVDVWAVLYLHLFPTLWLPAHSLLIHSLEFALFPDGGGKRWLSLCCPLGSLRLWSYSYGSRCLRYFFLCLSASMHWSAENWEFV